MARKQLGTSPSVATDTATKGYVDTSLSTASRLVVTTAQGAAGAEDGANTWAKVASINFTAASKGANLLLSFVGERNNVSTAESVVVAVYAESNIATAGYANISKIEIIAGAGGSIFSTDGFKIISGGYGTPYEVWVKKTASYSRVRVYELSRSITPDNVTVTYNDGAAWQSATPTGAVTNVTSNGVTAFGSPVVTAVNGSRFVGTTALGGAGAEDGGGTWSKIATFNMGTAYQGCSATLMVTSAPASRETAIVSVGCSSQTTGQNNIIDVQMLAKGAAQSFITPSSFKVVTGTYGTTAELWMFKNAAGGQFNIYELSKNITHSSGSITYYSSSAWQSATPTGTVTATTTGVTSFGLPVATTTGTETLTNKSLTAPNVDQLDDTLGNPALLISATTNGANYFRLTGSAATGSMGYVALSATGSDPNNTIQLAPKGTGTVEIFTTTGNTPKLYANGVDANLNLNLASKGTGVVQANGVQVDTISGTATLTNKTMSGASNTFSAIPATAVTGLDATLKGLATQGDNLLNNPSFEYDLYTAEGSFNTSIYRNGVRSMKLTGNGSAPLFYGNVTATGPLQLSGTTGETFYIETWVYGDAANTGNTGTIEIAGISRDYPADSQQWYLVTLNATTALNGVWTKLSGTVQISQANAKWVTFATRLNGVPAGNSFYFDDQIAYRTGVLGSSTAPALVRAGGSDTNISLNLASKGTGTVQANGVDVVTTTGARSLTNKTINSATINSPTLAGTVFNGAQGNLTINMGAANAQLYVGNGSDYGMLAYCHSAGNYSALSTSVSTVVGSLAGDLIVTTRKEAKSIIFGTTPTGNVNTDVKRMEIKSDGNVVIGTPTLSATASPISLSLGGTYGNNTAGDTANVKLAVFNDGGSKFGFGVSASKMEYQVPGGAGHYFYIGGAEAFSIGSGGTSGLKVGNGADVITSTATQTLSNKSLASPILTGTTVIPMGSGLELNNVSDATTNYEKLRLYHTGNVFIMDSVAAGTGSRRPIQIISGGSINISSAASLPSASNGGTISFAVNTGTPGAAAAGVCGTFSASSGTQYGSTIMTTINQSSTAGYTGLLINLTETATGSGSKRLIDAQVGSTSKFVVYNDGSVATAGALTINGVDAVTTTGTQTLTNKTLTSPRVNTLLDTNGKTLLDSSITTNAVNYAWVANGAAGDSVQIGATGADSAVNLLIRTKGVGSSTYIVDAGAYAVAQFQTIASPVNYWKFSQAATGNAITATATGSDTNIGLNLISKGSGTVQANGVEVVTTSGTQSLTNKTLPYATLSGSVVVDGLSGNGQIYTGSSNANASLYLYGKGTGGIYMVSGAGAAIAGFYPTVSNVNYISFQGSTTGLPVKVMADGNDTNCGINLIAKGTGTVQANGVDVVTTTGTQTLTNKRVTPRVNSTTSSATPSINTDTTDQYNITALAAAITGVTVTGTPTDGQKLMVRIKDNGTARAITWGSSFVSSGTGILLTTTVINKTHLVGFIYDSTAAKWVCVACDAVGY